MPLGELASAKGLVVHTPFLYQGATAFLKATSAPILAPPKDTSLMPDRTYLNIIGNCVRTMF